MKAVRSFRSNLRYGRSLVKSGASGLSAGREAYLKGQPLSGVLTESARASLGLATLGACAGLLACGVQMRRNRRSPLAACGMVGSVLGFAAGLAWKTRGLTGRMTRSAVKQINLARDEHLIAGHPIDYG